VALVAPSITTGKMGEQRGFSCLIGITPSSEIVRTVIMATGDCDLMQEDSISSPTCGDGLNLMTVVDLGYSHRLKRSSEPITTTIALAPHTENTANQSSA